MDYFLIKQIKLNFGLDINKKYDWYNFIFKISSTITEFVNCNKYLKDFFVKYVRGVLTLLK